MSNLIKAWAGNDGDAQLKVGIPNYLKDIYWWAYVHPNAVHFFERQWLINLILWGNFARLRDAALNELGREIRGRVLQVACVYGNFSVKLVERLSQGASLDIVDALLIQLENVIRKIPHPAPVRILQCDSARLKFADAAYDQAILFFLLHEMPVAVREKTLREAIRVLKPGGKLVIMDYHKPSIFHPLRYLFQPVLRFLEPFAMDLWKHPIERWFPQGFIPNSMSQQIYFGGLYQKVVIVK
jgi:ubiquinone/menaquinone biosynthesis C-methylase UbiE